MKTALDDRIAPLAERARAVSGLRWFARMPYDIYHWYSRRSLNMSAGARAHAAPPARALVGRDRAFVPARGPLPTHGSVHGRGRHPPAGAYIISSQFLPWHYHESDQAERPSPPPFHLAETLTTGGGRSGQVMPRAPLKERYLDNV